MKLFQEIASAFQAKLNCDAKMSAGLEWSLKHQERIEYLCANELPSGSGVDSGVSLDMLASKPERLVFDLSFHHMDPESGMYDGWTHHSAIVTPSLAHGFKIRITGQDKRDVKDYLADLMHDALSAASQPRMAIREPTA